MTTVKRAVVDKGRSLTSFSSHRAPSLENHSRLITSKRKLANAQTIRFGCLFASLIFTISPQWSAKGVSSLGWEDNLACRPARHLPELEAMAGGPTATRGFETELGSLSWKKDNGREKE
mgnify:CR=1 FL=1